MTNPTDALLGFTIASRNVRGRVVRLGNVLEQVLGAHGYPPAMEKLLGEALVLAALLGSTLQDGEGQMTMQAQTQAGVVDLLVCDFKGGALRGYVKHDAERIAALPQDPTLKDLFGEGYLAITFDQAVSGERYQGVVPLEGHSLAEAAESYFARSEQIPSLFRTAMIGDVAGGILLQHLPEGEVGRERLHVQHDHPDWEHAAIMAGSVKAEELCDPDLPLDDLIWRFFHEEGDVRVFEPATLSRGCRCDVAHIRSVLAKFPEDEREDMKDANGEIIVDCAFCSKNFNIAF